VESVSAASTTSFVGQLLLLLAASAQGSGTLKQMHRLYLHFIT
jgi:hypothetical protein